MTENIKILLIKRNMTVKELAVKLNTTSNNISNKFKRNNFSVNELKEIANAVDCRLDIAFIDKESNSRII